MQAGLSHGGSGAAPTDGAAVLAINGEHRSRSKAPSWLAVGCVVSVLAVVAMRLHPPAEVVPLWRSQCQALARVALTTMLATVLLLGPGLALRARWARCTGLPLGFVPLVGIGALATVGVACGLTAQHVDPRTTALGGVLAILVATGLASARPDRVLVDRGEREALAVSGLVLLFVLGRMLWSLGPEGELYGGSISRTLEVGDRPDPRVSYHVTSLIAHGLSPYESAGAALFAPYAFLDRGPLPGAVSAPVMLAVGSLPTVGLPDQPWSLFDVQGFMAYRIVMALLALTALLAVYSLVRLVGGPDRARLALLVTAGTPFFVHEVYFTWPKLAAAALCLLAAYTLLTGRTLAAGVLVGVGYLMHPLALLGGATLGLLVLLREWQSPVKVRDYLNRVVKALALLGAGAIAVAGGWRLLNHGQGTNGHFLSYFWPRTPDRR